VVGLAGAAPWVEEGVAELRRRVAPRPAHRRADGAACRQVLADLAARGVPAIVRVATLPTELGSFVMPAMSSLAAEGHALDLTAHVANGVARVGVCCAASTGAVLARLRRDAPPGAVVVVDRAMPSVKAALDVWGTVPAGRGGALMAALKREIDPSGSFAPGRFVCT
jgi:hypothetical protein